MQRMPSKSVSASRCIQNFGFTRSKAKVEGAVPLRYHQLDHLRIPVLAGPAHGQLIYERVYLPLYEHERIKPIEGAECRLMRVVNSMATLEGRMNEMADDMREIRELVQHHVDAPVDIMEHLIDS